MVIAPRHERNEEIAAKVTVERAIGAVLGISR